VLTHFKSASAFSEFILLCMVEYCFFHNKSINFSRLDHDTVSNYALKIRSWKKQIKIDEFEHTCIPSSLSNPIDS
jgi:hypothetical protein